MDDRFFSFNWKFSTNVIGEGGAPDDYVTKITGDIVLGTWCDKKGDFEESEVGSAELLLLEMPDISLLGLVLDYDSSTAPFYAMFEDREDPEKSKILSSSLEPVPQVEEYLDYFYGRMLILEHVRVRPEGRGHGGVFPALLKSITPILAPQDTLMVLEAFPLQFSASRRRRENSPAASDSSYGYDLLPTDEDASTEKLIAHYAKAGFQRLDGTNLMFMDSNRRLYPDDQVSEVE